MLVNYMSDKDLVKALVERIQEEDETWCFSMGRTNLTRDEFITKVSKDRKFRKTIVSMVNKLSIDILLRRSK